MAKWLYGLANGAVEKRRVVLALWLVILAVAGVLGTSFAGRTSDTFTIPGIESQTANDLLATEFPGANGGTIRVVFAAPEGSTLDDPATQTLISDSLNQAGTAEGAIAVTPLTTSPDQRIAFADVVFLADAMEVTDAGRDAVFEAVEPVREAGVQVEFAGSAAVGETHLGSIGEIIGVVIAFIVLMVTFGSLIAAGLPLVSAIIGVGIGLMGAQFASRFFDMSSVSSTLALMLGLAVGIDYALFIVARHREQLADPTISVQESIARAIGTAGSAVVFAGLTVIIALSALAVVGIPFLTVMGFAAAGTVAVAVIVALTLVPALLGFAGERLRPKVRKVSSKAEAIHQTNTFWRRWGMAIQKAPVAVLVVGVAVLLVLAVPATHMRLGLPSNAVQPESSTLHQSYNLLTEGFGEGFNSTIVYVVDATGIAPDARAAVVDDASALIAQDADVAMVNPANFNQAGTIAILSVVPFSGPDDEATQQLVDRLREGPREVVEAAGGAAYVTGVTPLAIDVSAKLAEALPLFIGVIVVLAMILLAIAFRSILVPIKAVLGFLLTIAVSLGATVWIFQDGNLLDWLNIGAPAPLVSFIPVILIGVLFGLAMDYELFLVSRMREEFHHTNDAGRSVLMGLGQSGRVVTAAALIMSAVFGAFLIGDDAIIKTIAFALAFGVLIDAFVVRMTLVPAVMFLLGKRAWWIPVWLDRVLPNVDIEGASLPERVASKPAQPVDAPAGEAVPAP
jgi:RND superfamily putative drug exporter